MKATILERSREKLPPLYFHGSFDKKRNQLSNCVSTNTIPSFGRRQHQPCSHGSQPGTRRFSCQTAKAIPQPCTLGACCRQHGDNCCVAEAGEFPVEHDHHARVDAARPRPVCEDSSVNPTLWVSRETCCIYCGSNRLLPPRGNMITPDSITNSMSRDLSTIALQSKGRLILGDRRGLYTLHRSFGSDSGCPMLEPLCPSIGRPYSPTV